VSQGRVLGTRYSVLGTQYLHHLAALVLLLTLCRAVPAGDDEPPLVGQPAHFNGAVGRFRVTVTAAPTKLPAEDPLTYTVRVTADGPAREPPQCPPIADFSGFAEGFYIESLGPPEGTHPDDRTWEFAYRLKPKTAEVKAIPGFPFVFYRPGFRPPSRGYMTIYAPEIPITVGPVTIERPVTAPEEAFVLADGDVLRRDGDDRFPGPVVLALVLLTPPIGCLAWYFAWRRLYPDAARRARRRRSLAAQAALKALRGGPRSAEEEARRAAAAVADYLRHRLDLRTAEPTPAEAEAHLRRVGVSEPLARRTAAFLRTCAAVRFDPAPPPSTDLADSAAQVILALEGETWSE
jgi:hypothetical protein